jgi:hypothetical protein
VDRFTAGDLREAVGVAALVLMVVVLFVFLLGYRPDAVRLGRISSALLFLGIGLAQRTLWAYLDKNRTETQRDFNVVWMVLALILSAVNLAAAFAWI